MKEGNPTTVKTPLEQETNLESATSWEMQAYTSDDGWVFLDVILTNLRPDIVLWPHEGKRIIMVGLTVPWEERC